MRAARLSHPVRSAAMIVAGTALILGPLALELGSAAMVTAVTVGILATSLGLAGTAAEGRGTLSVGMQSAYDRGLALGLLLTAVVFGASGDTAALGFFALTGVAVLLVAATTRYGFRNA